MYCTFCYGEFFYKGHSPAKLDKQRKNRLKIGTAFYKTIQTVLGIQPKCNLGKDSLESSCSNCFHIINSYCKLAFQMQCFQLRLNWETEQLLSVIKKANKNAAKHKHFQENFIIPEDITTILKFRQDFLKKGAQELIKHAGPVVALDKADNLKMPNEMLPQSDKENGKPNAHVQLKISRIISLQNVNVIENQTSEEDMDISPCVEDINKTVNTDNENKTSMESKEIMYSKTKRDFQLHNRPEEINGVVLIKPKYETDNIYDNYYTQLNDVITSRIEENDDISHYYEPDLYTPNVILSVPKETPDANIEWMNPCQDGVSNMIDGDYSSKQANFMENDTVHDVSGNAFICHIPGCGKSFEDERSFQWHHVRHEGRQEMVNCSYCAKGFLNDNFLRQHIKIHQAILPSLASHKKWTCEKCNTQFSTKFNLRRHIMNQHPSDPLPPLTIPNSMKRGYKPNNAYLSRKQKRVIGFGSLQRMFNKGNQSGSGQRIRWRNPKYPCAVCEKLFWNSFKLNEHMRTHSGVRPFGCAFCTWRFATKSNLKRHVRLVHKI